MDSFQSVLGEAAGGALCQVLSAYGSLTPELTVVSLIEPTPFVEVVATTAALSGLAAKYGCTYDPNAPGPPRGPATLIGCKKVSPGGEMNLNYAQTGDPNDGTSFVGLAIEVIKVYQADDGFGVVRWLVDYIDPNNQFRTGTGVPVADYPNNVFIGELQSGTCEEPAGPGPVPDPPTYTHTDPASGCELNVDFKGWGVGVADNINGIWEITPNLPPAATRASGGVISGCNFAPTIYIDEGGGSGDGGGGGRYFTVPDPIPPDGDEEWWVPLVRGLAQGLAAKATEALINKYFETTYGGGSYSLKGVCELDPDGNPMDVTRSTNFPEATSPDAILYRLDALADMFQFAKDLKQPICRETGQPITGDPVTINFASDAYTPTGNNVARKRFVYFDQVNSSLEATVNHWRDFTWQAGPVIVNCMNTKLGKPQVWAASLDEAKRVFAHAAAIAGVDLTDAKYPVSTPKNARYGFSGLMRVAKDAWGTYGITKRDGPDGLPPGLG